MQYAYFIAWVFRSWGPLGTPSSVRPSAPKIYRLRCPLLMTPTVNFKTKTKTKTKTDYDKF